MSIETVSDGRIFVGAAAEAPETAQFLDLKRANRHGLIAGATGTGKTVSLQILAEGFSQAGVPVFMADVKGDLGGLSQPGVAKASFTDRAAKIGYDQYGFEGYPTVFWDLYGQSGHPVRATISEMGPLLLGRLLELNETQSGVLNLVFKIADDEGYLLLDLKDLRALLTYVAEQAKRLTTTYGNVAPATVGAIQRRLLELEQQGAEQFFGEPALRLNDFLRYDQNGRGTINILAADRLINAPKLYGTFLLWLLSELFEELPEVGDVDKPKLVFFFDEAHLLFTDAPKALVEKVAQVVRLIRSKGVGVYFVTQSPLDLPDEVLGQLGNRIQHALRSFTPRDAKVVKAAASTFRQNPKINTEAAIGELGVGEALVSCLDAGGSPGIVERVLIRPPRSRLGPLTDEERSRVIAASPVRGAYDQTLDRDSAYEMLGRAAEAKVSAQAEADANKQSAPNSKGGRRSDTLTQAVSKSVLRSVASAVGRAVVGVLVAAFTKKVLNPSKATTETKKNATKTKKEVSFVDEVSKATQRSVASTLGREISRGVLGSISKK